MADNHSMDNGLIGTILTFSAWALGKIALILGAIALSDISNGLAIVVACATLFIKWPSIKDRMKTLKKKKS